MLIRNPSPWERGRSFRSTPLIPSILGSQEVGREVYYLIQAYNAHGDALWCGRFDDPDAHARFLLAFMRADLRGERRLSPEVARLAVPAWSNELFDCPSLRIEPRTVVRFTAVGEHSWTPAVFDPTWVNEDWWATVATYNSSNSTAAAWPTGHQAPAGVSATDYLVVAGGGGGGRFGGGGGAGGFLTATNYAVTEGTAYTITVGAVGSGSTTRAANGTNGGNSVFATITSTGGGGGNSGNVTGANTGGSGGGLGSNNAVHATPGASGTGGQGNAGGGNSASSSVGGGGGGASQAGADGNDTGSVGGNGGNGTASSISGSAVTYAGGGGGCAVTTAGSGGSGGGGAGAIGTANATAGTANTGGGGGGSRDNAGGGGNGGNGGTGVVILSFTAIFVATFSAPEMEVPLSNWRKISMVGYSPSLH